MQQDAITFLQREGLIEYFAEKRFRERVREAMWKRERNGEEEGRNRGRRDRRGKGARMRKRRDGSG